MSSRHRTTHRLPPCTDAGNAELFAALNKYRLRFDHKQKRWLIWGGHRWDEDTDQKVVQMAKQTARHRLKLSLDITDEDRHKRAVGWSLGSESRYRLGAAITLAKSEPSLKDSREWDNNLWLLGVGNGVVDLRTGTLRAGHQSDRITIHTDVPFNPSACCPLWEQFVSVIFAPDPEVIDFVHRAVGYSLTGDTSEQCAFLCFGDGSNGKSTFLETLRVVFGGYARNLPFSAFELKARSNIPNDLATLPGRRLVTAIETGDSTRLNEARLKALTGCDVFSARPLYKEFFEFRPVAKFWLAFNHKPHIADDSHEFWRRVRLIPFLRQFDESTADKHLLDKLRVEAPGILAWAVRGCLAWQAEGLGMPTGVRAATEAYREESDHVSEFVEDCCVLSQTVETPNGAMWQTYLSWCERNHEIPLTRNIFSERLQRHGCSRARDHRGRWWKGIGLQGGCGPNFGGHIPGDEVVQ